ncbi:hypothetical protein TVAG_094770 [Trichomonas vaginalis G3]|uniref:Uncharacterized protein n=1 Tax=Trichomonas vaginalis (strain ATCC PRA-98 / G3) TaxID=412133 RepID=A2FWA6_TRIV3|nr:hypothetical protein TVAGG3_0173760 [Trichomonas vaginalis G3]EAX90808.1 hypothetical protein TVAG_094770 [Trichomonas vaginalis G3]KAI5548784.1 hypothetical protein TVAGG3_0173760 [Trichomonas vaginalis G3]|eukprot:XP_001303738.1 hypothetical protein [Trichomonas vaginalis G3]
MGNSQSGITDDEIIAETMKENFILGVVQSCVEGPIPFTQEVINKRKSTVNFVIITKGAARPAKIWHSSKILVVALTYPDPPIELHKCSFYLFHGQPFLAICVDSQTYYHGCFFMNKCRFFASREEFLKRILTCIDNYDDILAKYIMPKQTVPTIKMPKFGYANPYEEDDLSRTVDPFEFDSSSGFLYHLYDTNQKPEIQVARDLGSSVYGAISEPESVNYENQSEASSQFGIISEPDTKQINFAESNSSSAFNLVSEPESYSSMSGLSHITSSGSSNFGIVSESGSSQGSKRRKRRTNHQDLDEKLVSGADSISEGKLREKPVPRQSQPDEEPIKTLDQPIDLDSQESLSSRSHSSHSSSRRRNNNMNDSESGGGKRKVPDVESVKSIDSNNHSSSRRREYSSMNSGGEYSVSDVPSMKSGSSNASSQRRKRKPQQIPESEDSGSFQ